MTDGPLILDGREVSRHTRAELAVQASEFTARAGRKPGLAVLIVGDDPASKIYVGQKAKACAAVGFHSRVDNLPEETSQEELLSRIESLNADPAFDGILVQLPLPPHIDEAAVIETISPAKDVDGFHPSNVGDLLLDKPRFVPCTPLGILKMLAYYDIDPSGKEAVIIGRSNIVGKPAAVLLLRKNATVTICHSRTADLAAHTRRADLVVAAVGRAGILTADMVKPGAVIIDVGMNRLEGRKVVGDVDFEGLLSVAGAITPVPGGVGPMTITMLLSNTLLAARMARGEDPSSP
jgi:methylenetetrahydrofolate dehydrogenase (NADP+)/methenyltetrahydrofolate cyclohydrolase